VLQKLHLYAYVTKIGGCG